MPERPPGRLEEVRYYVRSGEEPERIRGPISCKDKKKKFASYHCKQMSSSNNLRETRELTMPWLNLRMRTQPSCPLDCRPVSHPCPTPRSRAEELAKLCLDS